MKANVPKPEPLFWQELKESRSFLTKQQYRTIKGQAAKGKIMDARKGLKKVMMRRNVK
jgi:hypothetical protein